LPDKIIPAVAQRVQMAAVQLEADVKNQKLTGQALNVRSGRLRRSIHTDPITISDSKISTTVGTNVEYAKIHEYGGTTKPHDIFPKEAQALAFTIGGKQVVVKHVKHPGSHMPERSFLRSQLEEDRQMIRNYIVLGVQEGIKS
jgi:phage gpG-like protein